MKNGSQIQEHISSNTYDLARVPNFCPNRNGLLVCAMIAAATALFFLFILVGGQSVAHLEFGPLLILILAVLLAVIALVPALVSMRLHVGRLDLFHPLFYAAWFFFIPQFAISSFLIVLGNLETSAALFLPDPWTPRVKALEYAILGSIGLTVGYFLPIGKRLGQVLPNFKVLDFSRKIKDQPLI